MVNQEIADIFERMARVLSFKGKDRYCMLAYEHAATSLRSLDRDLEELAAADELEEIPGIGRDLSQMIKEYLRTGHIRRYEKESRDLPDQLLNMMEIPGIGPKTMALLHRKYRIKNIEDLKLLIESGKLKGLRGDLHLHTTYSDGRSTIEEMVNAAAHRAINRNSTQRGKGFVRK